MYVCVYACACECATACVVVVAVGAFKNNVSFAWLRRTHDYSLPARDNVASDPFPELGRLGKAWNRGGKQLCVMQSTLSYT